jgi:hypothetical protein
MSIERIVLAVAGFLVVFSVLMAHAYDPNWLWVTGFVGFNLFQSAFTGFCPLAKILKAAGRKTGPAFG